MCHVFMGLTNIRMWTPITTQGLSVYHLNFGVYKPPLKGPLGVCLTNVSTVFACRTSHENPYFVRVSAVPQHASRETKTVSASPDVPTLNKFRAQAYQPILDLWSGFFRIAKSPMIF